VESTNDHLKCLP